MGQKLTIVVTCTDRKSTQPDPSLMLRNLPLTSTVDRVGQWLATLRSGAPRMPLRKFYRGESWTQALRLEATARHAGFSPRLLVASAGLGLVEADHAAPAYAATFAARQPDSVGTNLTENHAWWHALASSSESARHHLSDPTLLVVSKNYANAMAQDIQNLTGRDDVVVFGGSDAIPANLRVAADRGLRSRLGGTATSLNLRMAIAWVERLPSASLVGNVDHAAWRTWAAESSRPETYDRQPLTDAEVLSFVHSARQVDPTLSKTRALRLLRDSGCACEQRRFGSLFDAALEVV